MHIFFKPCQLGETVLCCCFLFVCLFFSCSPSQNKTKVVGQFGNRQTLFVATHTKYPDRQKQNTNLLFAKSFSVRQPHTFLCNVKCIQLKKGHTNHVPRFQLVLLHFSLLRIHWQCMCAELTLHGENIVRHKFAPGQSEKNVKTIDHTEQYKCEQLVPITYI